VVQHDHILGQPEGVLVTTGLERLVWAYRPRMLDYVMAMHRQSAIIYPKDVAFLLMWADIFPGAHVFEAGLGSGSLSMALLRAIGPAGRLVSYEARADMADQARRNVRELLGEQPQWTIRVQDVRDGIEESGFDRAVLDLPDPGAVADQIGRALAPGGILCFYVPNVTQVQAGIEAFREGGRFVELESYEVSFRPWEFRDRSAHPTRSYIGHTGFLTFARRSLR
jgi:tRNA (adenine57-N1/adenine58-N1)-methyltransferase